MSEKKDLNKAIVSPEYISETYDALDKMDVELDEDPLDYGPSRLNSKIKQCRDYLSIVEKTSLRASRKLLGIKETHRATHKLYQIEEDRLMNGDPDVRAGRNIDDRRAIARLKLPEQVAELIWLEQGIEDMQNVLDSLKFKQIGLKNVQSQIKEQRNLCNEDLALGRTWRHKHISDPGLRPGTGRGAITNAVEDETESLLSEMDSTEVDLPALEETKEKEPVDVAEKEKDESPNDGESPDLVPAKDVEEPADTASELDIESFLVSDDEPEDKQEEDTSELGVNVDSLLDLLSD
jgi:hypothetical protein